jgi:outer membrane protein assembly factor BamB
MRLGRRSALLLPLALTGCSWLDDVFYAPKKPLPGERLDVLEAARGLKRDNVTGAAVSVPPAQPAANWPQAGGGPAHLPGNRAVNSAALTPGWSAKIGEGGGYRQKILSEPLVVDGTVYVMDSDAVVSAIAANDGGRLWRTDTKNDDDDSTNVGGGIAFDGGTIYAVNGTGYLVALDAKSGEAKYRQAFGTPARSSPTVVDGRVFFTTIDDKLIACGTVDGKQVWSRQAQTAITSALGHPAPAVADGLVIAGFGSGELSAVQAVSGGVAWVDALGSARGLGGLTDVASIRGLPVIDNGRVYAIGLGGLMVCSDARSGRRIWERDIAGASSPCVAGNWVFVISVEQQVAAISAADGKIAWIADLPRYQNPDKREDPIDYFGPVLAGGKLLLAGTTGQLLSLDPANGATLATQELDGPASVRPIIANGTVYVLTDSGRLQAFG